MTTTFPLIMTSAGPQPTPPATLNAGLIALVAATNPGYTANLPGSLIEDVSSTITGALVLMDQARVETVESLTPYGANAFLLNQLGQIYGVPQGEGSNASVYVVFSGPPGYVISKGFTVADSGGNAYIVQDGGVIASGGASSPNYALASQNGVWAIPPNSVQSIITSVPVGITLTVTNPSAGTQSVGQQSTDSYRAQVLQAGLAVAQGLQSRLRSSLENITGVEARQVGIVKTAGGSWEIIVGGGDPYEVAYAISAALFDIFNLVGSQLVVTNITVGTPGVVSTNYNHGLVTGSTTTLTGVEGMTEVNGVPQVVTVIDEKTFSIASTAGFTPYTGGGILNPNSRNATVALNYYPDTLPVIFVIPPQQLVTISLTWNTSALNYVSPSAVQQAGATALISYVNSIYVGQPINLFELQNAFQLAVASLIPAALLTRMVFSVAINGITTSPEAGTGIIAGDPESYFFTSATSITIVQG